MKKVFGIFTSGLLILILLFSLFCFNVSAASASVRLSSNATIKVGDKVTVTCVFDAGEKIVTTDHKLEYDNKLMKYVSSTDQGVNNGSFVQWANPEDGNKTSYQATFEAIAEGKNYFKFLGYVVANEDNPHYVSSDAGVIVTIEPKQNETPQKSTNANLASLSVNGGALSPKFAANTVTYNVTVPNSASKVTIIATAQDQKAKISGVGACDLKVGKNVKTVTVTAESGAKKTYTLNITRQEQTSSVPVDSEPSAPTDPGIEDPIDPEPKPIDPLVVTAVDGSLRRIIADTSQVSAPAGFMASVQYIEGIEVGKFVEADGNPNYELYFTSDEDGEDADYFYETPNGYKRLAYMTVNNKLYIVETPPNNMSAPNGYYETAITLNGTSAPAFKFEDSVMSDFYVLYCYTGGKYGYYRFDSAETTIQRSPDFSIMKSTEADTKETIKETSLISDLLQRYKNTTVLGKIIVFAIIACAALIVATVIVLIVKLFKDKNDDEGGDGPFGEDDEYYTSESLSVEDMEDISSFASGSIPFVEDGVPSDTQVADVVPEPEDTVAQGKPEIAQEPAVKEPAPSESQSAGETDEFDDDFGDEESLKNLRGF